MTRVRLRKFHMRRSVFGKLVVLSYAALPFRTTWLKIVVRLEGGDLYSLTLRDILRKRHGVEVGEYSYGSLMIPGQADAQTTIGRYVSIGPGVRRIGASHPLARSSLHPFWYNKALGLATLDDDVIRSSCAIGSDSWIGANVVILPGCKRVGIGAVVGAGSILTSNVPDFAIFAGNPARQIGLRLSEQRRARLLDLQPWRLPPQEMQTELRRVEREWS